MKVGVFQALPQMGDKAANLSLMRRVVRGAAALGTELVIFSELFLTRYNLGDLTHSLAEPQGGPSMVAAQHIAAESKCAIAYGYPERDGALVYNSMAVLNETGELAGHYRKIQLFGDEEKRLFTAGGAISTCTILGHKIGLGICYDIEFPEIGRRLANEDVRLVIVPTANMKPYWEVPTTLVRARALENGYAIAYANQCGSDDDFQYSGLSCLVGADGQDIARAGIHAEAFIVAETDLSDGAQTALTSTQTSALSPTVSW